MTGLIPSDRLRLPLIPATPVQRDILRTVLEAQGLLARARGPGVSGQAPAAGLLRIVPLGGSGEIGKNMYVIELDGDMVVIDCGVAFPTADQLGVDLVLPDFELRRPSAATDSAALVLTHGHEDHIGAVPYFLRTVGPTRIYGTRFMLGMLRSKLDEHRLTDAADMVEIEPGVRRRSGPSAPSSST